MTNNITVITNASWEERYHLGIKRIITEKKPNRLISFYLKSFSHLTENSRKIVENECIKNKIAYIEIGLENSSNYWKKIEQAFSSDLISNEKIYLDISTMPREIIWILLTFLTDIHANIYYVYNEPEGYNKEWLSRNHNNPRLIFKLSGIYDLGKPTSLISISGFDIERTKHILNFFEPKTIKIGLQSGDQFDNIKRNYNLHQQKFNKSSEINLFELDAYDTDHGLNEIEKQVKEVINTSNIIICSLGPKLTAISIFKLHSQYPQIALAYIPSKEYNPNYSHGIKNCHEGKI